MDNTSVNKRSIKVTRSSDLEAMNVTSPSMPSLDKQGSTPGVMSSSNAPVIVEKQPVSMVNHGVGITSLYR